MMTATPTQVQELPFLFTRENRALVRLDLKFETRRDNGLDFPDPSIVKLTECFTSLEGSGKLAASFLVGNELQIVYSPYGNPEFAPVRYWVKEPVKIVAVYPTLPQPWVELIYLDDGKDSTAQACEITWEDYQRLVSRTDYTRPTTAMHMLKSFTRTWLRGVQVWPERLGDMSVESAIAEAPDHFLSVPGLCTENPRDYAFPREEWLEACKREWIAINGKGSWNPDLWVWAIKFEREKS